MGAKSSPTSLRGAELLRQSGRITPTGWPSCSETLAELLRKTHLLSRNTRKGHAGAFLAGVLGGFFSSPCASPVLVVLLGFVAQSGNMASGVMLLLLYSLGHSVLVLVAGTSISFVNQLAESKKFLVLGSTVKYVLGVSVLLVSFVMFYMGF